MDQLKEMQAGIAELEEYISLRQIALQSKINYITLRNIKGGKSQRVTAGVSSRFKEFKNVFDPAKVDKKLSRRGKKAKAAAAKPAPAPAAPAPAAVPALTAAPAPAAAPKKKPIPRKRAVTAVPAKTVAKKKRKYTRKAGKKVARVPVKAGKTVSMLGNALKTEIVATEARLEYLKKMQIAEVDYQKALGKQ